MAGGMKIETVKTGSFTMDYFRFGHGKDALVIIPGLSVQSVMLFADTVALAYHVLTDDYTVYVVDRRKEMPEEYSIYEMAENTAEVLDAIGLKKVSVLGVSQGGMIGMAMAAGHPDLVENLVLCSSAAIVTEEANKVFDEWIDIAKSGDTEKLYLSFGEKVYSPEMFEQVRGILVDAAKSVTDEELRRFIIQAESMKDFDFSDELKKIRCPIYVIGAEDDKVLQPDASPNIVRHLTAEQDYELRMYDGYGHAVFDAAPDFKESMLAFLKARSAEQQ